MWDLEAGLPLEDDADIPNLQNYRLTGLQNYRLTGEEQRWIDVWEDFVQTLRPRLPGEKLPGFPIWADAFVSTPEITDETPAWEADFLRENSALYNAHAEVIDAWFARHGDLASMPPSRRKFVWQAQDTASLWDTIMHFHPSGIRAKKPTYVPALVAITQATIVGSRRLTPVRPPGFKVLTRRSTSATRAAPPRTSRWATASTSELLRACSASTSGSTGTMSTRRFVAHGHVGTMPAPHQRSSRRSSSWRDDSPAWWRCPASCRKRLATSRETVGQAGLHTGRADRSTEC
ncbi:MAG: hypothetical protein ACYC1Z_07500 [Georgenia sp.]